MDIVIGVAVIVALVAQGMALLARAEVRRLRAKPRTVVVTLTVDTSAFDAAIASVHADMRRLARGWHDAS